MFLHHLCIVPLVGFAPAHVDQEMCDAGVERAALCAILFERGFSEDVLTDSNRASVEKLNRRGRCSKYLRLLREFARGASLAATDKIVPSEWADHWNTHGAGAGASRLRCCRGPPVVDRGSSSHNQSGALTAT